MSTQTILQITAKLLAAASAGLNNFAGSESGAMPGVLSPPASTTPTSNSLSLGITTDVGAGFTAAGKVADLILEWARENNTPEMIQASEAQKLQDFKDRVLRDLQTGNEADLEKLES